MLLDEEIGKNDPGKKEHLLAKMCFSRENEWFLLFKIFFFLMTAIFFFFSKEVFIECYNIALFYVLGFCPRGMWDHSSLTRHLTKIIILFPFYGR